MDEAEGGAGGGYGNGGDPGDNFVSVEAISAVADDGFLGEEDDDYEDLYNDVNVGEGFLQSLRKNEEKKAAAASSAPVVEPQVPPQLPPSASAGEASRSTISGVGGGGEGTKKLEIDIAAGGGDSRISSSRLGEYPNHGFGGSDTHMTTPHGPGMGPGSGPSAGGVGGPYGGGAGDGLRVQLGQPSTKVADVGQQTTNTSSMAVQGAGLHPSHDTNIGNTGNTMARQLVGGGNVNGTGGTMMGGGGVGAMGAGGGGGGSGTILFVGELHWWTTDAELEAELVKYGPVKEVKFFDEKASGKSKGYCQVEFYDSAAATACKEGMNGHAFNGRSCVVAYASPFTVKKMGEAQVNKSQQMGQQSNSQVRRGPNDAGNRPSGNNIATGGNYQGADNNRGYGRGNWGRGNAQMGNRGPVGPIRNRPGGMGGRGIMPNAGNGFGQGMGAAPPMMHPQPMMGQGFDPAFGGPMGRMGNFGGYPGGPGAPFQGMMPNFPPVASVGLPGVAPHVNPAFFGRGMPMNGMGMMPNAGVDGPNMGMWSDPNMAMGGWAGDEHAMRAAESSYGEDAVSEHHYGEVSHDRVGRPSAMKEKERGERDWSGSSDRRYRDDREPGYDRDAPREKNPVLDQDLSGRRHRDVSRERDREQDRERGRSRDRERDRERDLGRDKERDKDRYRDDRERYADHHRSRDREPDYDDEWDRGRPSRSHSKSRMEEERSRSRDPDYGKRRRLTSS